MGNNKQLEQDRGFQKEAHHFIQVCDGCTQAVREGVTHTKSCTRAPKEKKTYKCKMLCKMFISLCNDSRQLLPCVAKKTGGRCTDTGSKRSTEDVGPVQRDRKINPRGRDVVSSEEYGTRYYLFFGPTEKPIPQTESMKHSLSTMLHYTVSSAICVYLSLLEKHARLPRAVSDARKPSTEKQANQRASGGDSPSCRWV